MDEGKFVEMYQNIINQDYANNSNMQKRLLRFGGKKKLCKIMFNDEKILAICFAMNTDDPAAVSILVSDDVLVITNHRLIYLQNRLLGTLTKEFPLDDTLSFSWSSNNKLHIKCAGSTVNMYVNDSGLSKVKRVLYNLSADDEDDEDEDDGYDTPVTNKFCHSCGKRIADGMSFCPNCGTKLTDPSLKKKDAPIVQEQEDNRDTNQYVEFKIGGNTVCFNKDQWFYIQVRKPFEIYAEKIRQHTISAIENEYVDFDTLITNIQPVILFVLKEAAKFGVSYLNKFSVDNVDENDLLIIAEKNYKIVSTFSYLEDYAKSIKLIEDDVARGVNVASYIPTWKDIQGATAEEKLKYVKKDNYNKTLQEVYKDIYDSLCNIYFSVEDILVDRGIMKRAFDNEAMKDTETIYRQIVVAHRAGKIDKMDAIRHLTFAICKYPFHLWPIAYLHKISPNCRKDVETLCEALGITISLHTWLQIFKNDPKCIPGFES